MGKCSEERRRARVSEPKTACIYLAPCFRYRSSNPILKDRIMVCDQIWGRNSKKLFIMTQFFGNLFSWKFLLVQLPSIIILATFRLGLAWLNDRELIIFSTSINIISHEIQEICHVVADNSEKIERKFNSQCILISI